MARAKKVTDSKPEWVRVKVTKSFDLMTMGETIQAPLSERVLSLISGGFLEVTEYGPSASGPGSADASDQGGSPADAEAAGPAGAEPGQDFGAGGYGSPA